MRHYGDITKLSGYDLPIVDVITGGSPCQDLSVAGKRAGLDGERSGLFMEQIRIVKEMRERDKRDGRTDEYIRPRYMVWENVPGAFSSNKGKDFQAVLTEIVRIVEPECPDVPMPDKGRWNKSGCLYDDMGKWSIAWRVHDAQFWGVPQRRKRIALVADFGGLTAPEILFERKGVSRDTEPCGKTGKGTAGTVRTGIETASGVVSKGNGEAFLMDEKTSSLTIGGGQAGQGYPCVMAEMHGHQPISCGFKGGQSASSIGYQEECSPTLNANMSALEPTVVQQAVITYGLDRAAYNQGKNAKFNFSVEEEKVGAQVARGPGAVCQSVVRRLTPLECERLQGFPDHWTDIGEWVDSKGKKHKEADSPRYKALGNSIAIPFWFYLLRRISAQYERPATLGSLFDGIGGFPYCWERCNGKGTAIWASEIEEFPIAVTKRHFPEED